MLKTPKKKNSHFTQRTKEYGWLGDLRLPNEKMNHYRGKTKAYLTVVACAQVAEAIPWYCC
jgi:hypothetical protein